MCPGGSQQTFNRVSATGAFIADGAVIKFLDGAGCFAVEFLCAVDAVLGYLVLRGNSDGPLFLLQSGMPLSRSRLSSWLRTILEGAGIPGNYSSHSFRIGAATVAARNGIPDHLIQSLGRWSSNAYQLYIRTPSEALANLSQLLV